MNPVLITRIFAFAGMAVGLLGLSLRLRATLQRPFKADLSRGRGSSSRGVLYAFTLGMAPWEKESTRLHWIAYLRGIFFHVGIFSAYGVVICAPYLDRFLAPVIWLLMAVTGAGALFGFAGIFMRYSGKNERVLSLPDDYFSVFLTAVFILLAFATLFSAAFAPSLYILTGLLSVYAPFSKIRHCAYFFYSKFIFGKSFGHRGVLGPENQKVIR
jgi:hypothetical protein